MIPNNKTNLIYKILKYKESKEWIKDTNGGNKGLETYLKDEIIYKELEQQLTGISTPQIQVVGNQLQIVENQLQQIDAKLNIVLIKQDSLLSRYQASEQAILRVIIEQLNQTQLAFTENMLNAVAANQVSES
jgi:hypothetical protein